MLESVQSSENYQLGLFYIITLLLRQCNAEAHFLLFGRTSRHYNAHNDDLCQCSISN